MQCPISDGELISHTTQGENNLTVFYSTCPTCHGHWMDSFAANFIKLPRPLTPERPPTTHGEALRAGSDGGQAAFCPICQKQLQRATGENIPDHVTIYTCPDGHGYFFPAGQLSAFKNAQQAKIAYHKLWNLPIPNVRSVLLAGLLMVILTGGLVTGYQALQNRQTVSSQAQGLFSSQRAYVTPNLREVLFTAETPYDATLTLHIPTFNNFEKVVGSINHRTHTLTVTNITPATYEYYFTITVQGEDVQSETYTFIMPQ